VSPSTNPKAVKLRESRAALKVEVLTAYSQGPGGPRCACCGEGIQKFLTVDHVHGGGERHRRRVGRGSKMYLWLKRHGFPPGHEILCWNCNQGRNINGGVCPHQEIEK
jgi:hypothetical protein